MRRTTLWAWMACAGILVGLNGCSGTTEEAPADGSLDTPVVVEETTIVEPATEEGAMSGEAPVVTPPEVTPAPETTEPAPAPETTEPAPAPETTPEPEATEPPPSN